MSVVDSRGAADEIGALAAMAGAIAVGAMVTDGWTFVILFSVFLVIGGGCVGKMLD